jgi:hypothetical protein
MKKYILFLLIPIFSFSQNLSQGMFDQYGISTLSSTSNRFVPSSVLFTEFATKAPTTGGTGYIQNGVGLQSSANYNISGSGLAANLTASTQFSAGAALLAGTTAYINTFSSSNIGLVIRGVASQTGVLASFQSSGGTQVAAVRPDGRLLVATPSVAGDATTKLYVDTADALKANNASPTLTGDPLAPTPTSGDNDTSIATTAFVQGEFSARTIINTTTTALTSAGLNTAYPSAPVGTRVICGDVGLGGARIYTKYSEAGSSDVWLETAAPVLP